jgi:hypothetical protein
MFAAIPPILALLARYYVATEAIKFATGTERKDWIKMSLDISEQIGNIYTARLREGRVLGDPFQDPLGVLYGELVTAASVPLGAPGTAAEALGYTFPGAAAKQRGRLEAEVTGGFPFTRKRIKGAPTFAKRKLSTWNREVKKAYKAVKAQKNQFGPKGKINNAKKTFTQVVKMVSKWHSGKRLGKSSAARQITKALKR